MMKKIKKGKFERLRKFPQRIDGKRFSDNSKLPF